MVIGEEPPMPIYEYRCERCGHELEALQKISDAPLTDCPACGESALKKLISAAAFRLKGGGWYETDFKKDGKKNLHESGDKPKADKPKADKSEGGTKPAAVDKKPAIEKKPAAEK
jgi:putative FmdB family regulatory protein